MLSGEEGSELASIGDALCHRRQRFIDSRRETRVDHCIDGPTLREAGGTAAAARLLDLSWHGFRTQWPYRLHRGKRVWLKINGLEALAAIVAWEANYTIGCRRLQIRCPAAPRGAGADRQPLQARAVPLG